MSYPSFAEISDALLSGHATTLADPVLAHGRLRTDLRAALFPQAARRHRSPL